MHKKILRDKYSVKKVNILYHLSDEMFKGGNKIMNPRVPESIMDDGSEDDVTGRVCLSTTMSGAFRAISFNGNHERLYVYKVENLETLLKDKSIIRPTTDMVYDQEFTNEHWSIGKTKLKCIGLADFFYNPRLIQIRQFRPIVRIKWIEKY